MTAGSHHHRRWALLLSKESDVNARHLTGRACRAREARPESPRKVLWQPGLMGGEDHPARPRRRSAGRRRPDRHHDGLMAHLRGDRRAADRHQRDLPAAQPIAAGQVPGTRRDLHADLLGQRHVLHDLHCLHELRRRPQRPQVRRRRRDHQEQPDARRGLTGLPVGRRRQGW